MYKILISCIFTISYSLAIDLSIDYYQNVSDSNKFCSIQPEINMDNKLHFISRSYFPSLDNKMSACDYGIVNAKTFYNPLFTSYKFYTEYTYTNKITYLLPVSFVCPQPDTPEFKKMVKFNKMIIENKKQIFESLKNNDINLQTATKLKLQKITKELIFN